MPLVYGFRWVEDRQLGDVVEHDEGEERDQHHEGGLVDAFLHVDADVAAHHALNQQQQDQSAIQDRKRHQVQDAEVEADAGGKAELRIPVFGLCRLAAATAMPTGPESCFTETRCVSSFCSTFTISIELSAQKSFERLRRSRMASG